MPLLKLVDLLCKKHNFYMKCLFLISTFQSRQHQDEQHIQTIAQSNGGRRRNGRLLRLFKSVFSQIFFSYDISQTGTDIKDPSGENVQDMEENNISKYRFDPTVKGEVIAVEFSAINISFL